MTRLLGHFRPESLISAGVSLISLFHDARFSLTPCVSSDRLLGSGKTTLLNRLLIRSAWANSAVLVNEFGDIPVDHLLVRASSERIAVLSNGCLCCSVAGDMVKALRELYFARANGEVPPFERVIVETTGLADPAPILHTLIDLPLAAALRVCRNSDHRRCGTRHGHA